MNTIHIAIDGMHCGGCVQRAADALKKVPGIQTQKVEIGKATLQAEPGQEISGGAAAIAALERLGFDARVAQTS